VESVNRPQMDIKRKTWDIRTWKEHLFLDMSSTNIDKLVPSLYQFVEIRGSATCPTPFQPLRHQRNFRHPVVNRFTLQTLPTVNRKYFFINNLCTSQKNRTTELCSSVVHPSSTIAILTTETSLCYLDCREAGLCCYLVIHIENLLYPLQLLYFHLWRIYWLSLVSSTDRSPLHTPLKLLPFPFQHSSLYSPPAIVVTRKLVMTTWGSDNHFSQRGWRGIQ
jgi:hypothetical protein